jgi:DNA-binding XRE family transcriptional regulator
MATTFAALMSGLREEAKAGGPEAVTQLEALGNRCRLGRQLAQARLDQNLSQAAVAKRAQVDRGDVSKIERGAVDPTLGTLRAVACAVGLAVVLKRRPGRRQGPVKE